MLPRSVLNDLSPIHKEVLNSLPPMQALMKRMEHKSWKSLGRQRKVTKCYYAARAWVAAGTQAVSARPSAWRAFGFRASDGQNFRSHRIAHNARLSIAFVIFVAGCIGLRLRRGDLATSVDVDQKSSTPSAQVLNQLVPQRRSHPATGTP